MAKVKDVKDNILYTISLIILHILWSWSCQKWLVPLNTC